MSKKQILRFFPLQILALSGILIFSFSCAKKETEKCFLTGTKQICGLATPVTLEPDSTTIVLSDYFMNTSLIDSVVCSGEYLSVRLTDDKTQAIVSSGQDADYLSTLNVYIEGVPHTLILKKSSKVLARITFANNNRKIGSVNVAGEMNNWNPESGKMKLDDGIWETTFMLNPGKYQYQIVIDGKWMLDPSNPDSADNNIGGFNSLLIVKEDTKKPKPVLSTGSISNGSVKILSKNDVEEVFVLWQNYLLSEDCYTQYNDSIIISIPISAESSDRSYLRVFAANNGGVSNDILIPLSNQKVVDNTSGLSPDDLEKTIMYFMLIDRFKNGNPNNDQKVDDPEVEEKANYYGGDLEGIKEEIDSEYFTKLNINTLWLSPIIQNPEGAFVEFPAPNRKYSGYHGYWPISSTNVDHRFGTNNDFKALVQDAHSHQLKVLIDFVANHVHQDHPLIQKHPDWATQLALADGRQNIRLWDEYRLTTWFDTFLPSLDFSKPEVTEAQSDSAMYWIKNFNIDGFRHDATKHIPEEFWRTLTRKIKTNKDFQTNTRTYQIGETFGSRELINNYVGSGILDAQFDFNLYFDSRTAFAMDNSSMIDLKNSLEASLAWYGSHHLMGNITGNHDIPRFISYAGEGLSFSEDEKEAGWTRQIEVTNPIGYKKLSMLTAFVMTIPGVPVVYYGDEFGMPGAGDPDNRRPMKFEGLSDQEENTLAIFKKISRLRSENIALIYGDWIPLFCNAKQWIYARKYFDKTAVIVFNKSDKEVALSVKVPNGLSTKGMKTNFDGIFSVQDDIMTIQVPPYSFEIITN